MAAQEPGAKQIDLTTLPIPHLNHLSQQLEQELEYLTTSVNQLKVAQAKFSESEDAVSQLAKPGKDILVPLTASMYVPGQLYDEDELMVDIGTGYYVAMTREKAQEFFKRKIDYLTKNIEKVQPVLQDKYRTKQVITEVMQAKIQASMASVAANGPPGGKP